MSAPTYREREVSTPTVRFQGAGAGWMERQLVTYERQPMSPLGIIVADILGDVYEGIYHLSHSALFHERTKWHDPNVVLVTVGGELANHDASQLTRLVLLCHAMAVRVSIRGAAKDYLRLCFSMRDTMFIGPVPDVATVVQRFERDSLSSSEGVERREDKV